MSFPWPRINNWVDIMPGELMIMFATETKMGKTTWLENILIHNVMAGKKVINFSAEISPANYFRMMAANLLRLANSVAFKGASPSVSLQQSVARLGATNVRQLAVVIACETRVFQVPGFEAEVRHLFRHSLTCAFAAREIARSRQANVEEAFLSGLLHDVGWPLMLQVLLDVTKRVGVTAERLALLATAGRHHAPLASHLATSWQLPERLRGALHQHHDEQFSGPGAESAATLALADALARVGEQDAAITPEAVHAHPALAVLNVYPDAVDALLAKAPTWWAEAA
jgi:putative nucleotidyltransferase with HDIG domain